MRHLALWPSKSLSNDLWKDFNNLFEEFNVHRPSYLEDSHSMNYSPTLDVRETEKNYIVHIDVPGMEKEDINIEVRDNTLYISGERKREEKTEDKVVRWERSFGRFERMISLPKDIDSEDIHAKYKDGVLDVKIAKSKSSKARTITIK